MLVTDPGVSSAGLVDRVLPISTTRWSSTTRPNPDIRLVDRAAEAYREAGCDGLVALGGGSSLDTAKVVGVVAVHGGSDRTVRVGARSYRAPDPSAGRDPHHAGTGSE
jgi:alcohol dehydrogenase class IV